MLTLGFMKGGRAHISTDTILSVDAVSANAAEITVTYAGQEAVTHSMQKGEPFRISENVTATLIQTSSGRGYCRISFEAPRSIVILRDELLAKFEPGQKDLKPANQRG